MLQRAYDLGFRSYCLSEHVPRAHDSQLYPEEIEANVKPKDLEQRFEEYLIEADHCSKRWQMDRKGQMQVLVGAELENIDGDCIQYMERVLNGKGNLELTCAEAGKGRLDYLIGSVHHVDGIAIDFDKSTFELCLDKFRREEDNVCAEVQRRRAHFRLILRYLDLQMELLQHFQPEIIGHFDLCRLFDPDTPMTMSDGKESEFECLSLLQSIDEKVHRNVEYICSYGGLIEINSASLRKGWKTPYPGQDILDIMISKGARVCLSDDAHSHEQVGLNYHLVKEYLERNGIKSIWMLQRASDPSRAFPRGTMGIEVPDWNKDAFWSTQGKQRYIPTQ